MYISTLQRYIFGDLKKNSRLDVLTCWYITFQGNSSNFGTWVVDILPYCTSHEQLKRVTGIRVTCSRLTWIVCKHFTPPAPPVFQRNLCWIHLPLTFLATTVKQVLTLRLQLSRRAPAGTWRRWCFSVYAGCRWQQAAGQSVVSETRKEKYSFDAAWGPVFTQQINLPLI